ncbi:MAG: DUF2924 domain-containing protein [Phycisphaeraceae bacterium]|nr:DUF2924 domain-containing protein [Phycisphaeraceae bacterium]
MTDAAPTRRLRPSSRSASRLNAALDVDLTRLDSLPLAALRDLWRTIGGRGEPVQRRLLIREIAHLVQSRRSGGMDKGTARLLAAAVRDAREEPAQPTRAARTSEYASDDRSPLSTPHDAAASTAAAHAAPVAKQRRSPLPSTPTALPTGARITRVWRGRTYEVTVVEGGKAFIYKGTSYRSLSRIALEITGTAWSGPLFFGLTAIARSRSKEPSR